MPSIYSMRNTNGPIKEIYTTKSKEWHNNLELCKAEFSPNMNKLTVLYYIPELQAEVEYAHFLPSNSHSL